VATSSAAQPPALAERSRQPRKPHQNAVTMPSRAEGSLSAQGAVQQVGQTNVRVDCSTTYLRPWGRLSLDATFKIGKIRPYFGADISVTPLKTSQTVVLPSLQYMDDRTLRSTAPNVSGAFYLGMHF